MDGSFSEANSQNAKCSHAGNLLVVQWLELCASTAGDMGSIPGQRTKISYAVRQQRGGGREKKKQPRSELYVLSHLCLEAWEKLKSYAVCAQPPVLLAYFLLEINSLLPLRANSGTDTELKFLCYC